MTHSRGRNRASVDEILRAGDRASARDVRNGIRSATSRCVAGCPIGISMREATLRVPSSLAMPTKAGEGGFQRRDRSTFSRGGGRDFRVSMQPNISQFQKRHFSLLARVSPFSIAGHLVNTTVVAFALVGSVPEAQLITWCIYSYSIALLLLYRHLRKRGRSPRDFGRAAKKVMTYSFFMALPWSSLVVLHLGALSRDQELIVVALAAGMAATGTILLSTVPPAAFVYMSAILIPSALKCLSLNEIRYLLLAALALSCWGFLAALIVKIIRDTQERERTEQSLAEQSRQRALAERAALVGSFAYDIHTDRIEISPGFAAIHGFPEETAEISRSEWLACLHPEDAERLYVLRSRAFSNRQREYNTDYRIVRSGGEVRWIDARSFIEYGDSGYPQRVVGVNIDITGRKQAEEQLTRFSEGTTARN